MAPFYSFNPNTTSINFEWPVEITGLERIALSAQGDLQRVLSAFFARPIHIVPVYSNTFVKLAVNLEPAPLYLPNPNAIASAAPDLPVTQKRQVLLQCAGKTVCTAISTVHITSAHCAHLFLEEKYAIGQMFKALERIPVFELLAVGFGDGSELEENIDVSNEEKNSSPTEDRFNQLWRRYKLVVPGFECEILEVFGSRDMFTQGEDWLIDGGKEKKSDRQVDPIVRAHTSEAPSRLVLLLTLGFLLMVAYELLLAFDHRRRTC